MDKEIYIGDFSFPKYPVFNKQVLIQNGWSYLLIGQVWKEDDICFGLERRKKKISLQFSP